MAGKIKKLIVIISLIIALIGLATAIIYLVNASGQSQNINIGTIDNRIDNSTTINTTITQNLLPEKENPSAAVPVVPTPEPPVPPKIAPVTEFLKISITEEGGGSMSAFKGDVHIALNNILPPDYTANGTITVKSSGEKRNLNNMDASSLPLEMGDYQIDIEDIAKDYAVFRITKKGT